MCTWRRPERLQRTITLLSNQTHPNIALHVWNNNPHARPLIDDVVSRATDLEVHVVHSGRNAGGFGRFYLARELAKRHPFVIFVDDDQTFGPTAVADFVGEFEPETVTSFWAFRFTDVSDYSARVAARQGERADYCGTCGMISDTRIFLEPDLFRCPRRFWFVEDLWLSYYADRVLGWELRKSAVELEMDDDGLDQYHYLHETKTGLLRYLVAAGWKIAS